MLTQVRFAGIKSLADVTVDLAPFTVFVGPNGCGKSTLLDQVEMVGAASTHGVSSHILGPVGDRLGGSLPHTIGAPPRMRWEGDTAAGASVGLQVDLTSPPFVRVAAHTLVARSHGGVTHITTMPPEHDIRAGADFNWSCQRLALVPAELARPSAVNLESLAPSGYGLPTVLKDLAARNTDEYLRVQADLRRIVPHFLSLKPGKAALPLTSNGPHEPVVTLALEMIQGVVDASQVSDGTLIALAILTVAHNPDLPSILLIDDIDHGLHLAAQVEMITAIRRVMAVRPALQVLCTTHSPVLLDSFLPSEVRVMALDAQGHTQVRSLADHPEAARYRELLQTGEFWASTGEKWVLDAKAS